MCNNKHSFDISKKGNLFLVNTKNYNGSKIYNKTLFECRREFIKGNYYDVVYDYISKIINSFNLNNLKILDLGCGEGTHARKIQERLKNESIIYGLDYSKDAINMATDYLKNGNFYFVADINNIPIKSNSIDIIINFLSPYNSNQVTNILRDNGYFIKIVPGKNYLKELRDAFLMNEYEKGAEVKKNVEKNFDIILEYEINEKKRISNNDLRNLINMTPIHNKKLKTNINEVTINLIIYIMKVRNKENNNHIQYVL